MTDERMQLGRDPWRVRFEQWCQGRIDAETAYYLGLHLTDLRDGFQSVVRRLDDLVAKPELKPHDVASVVGPIGVELFEHIPHHTAEAKPLFDAAYAALMKARKRLPKKRV